MIQVSESGWQTDADPIRWNSESDGRYDDLLFIPPREHRVSGEHRRRILDREAKHGVHPGPDGWLVLCHHDDHMYGHRVRNYTRLRWLDDLEEKCR